MKDSYLMANLLLHTDTGMMILPQKVIRKAMIEIIAIDSENAS